MATAKSTAAAKARLAKLDAQADKIERNKLRAKATYGSRKVRKKAASDLGNKPRKPKQQN